MKPSFRLVGAIIFAVGCILEGFSLYLLQVNWFYEEANHLYIFSNLSIVSTFILFTGFIWLTDKNIRRDKYPKKVLCLHALGFALMVLGFSILIILPKSFWLFLLFVIPGIVTYSMLYFYEKSHPEKFKSIKTNLTLQNQFLGLSLNSSGYGFLLNNCSLGAEERKAF